MALQCLVPITIGDAQLISSSVAEDTNPAWSAATAYVKGARVHRPTLHKVFERLVAGTTSTAPEADAANWGEVGATNRWAMFDSKVGSATVVTAAGAATLSVTLRPGATVRAISLLDLDADAVTISIVKNGVTLFTRDLPPTFGAAPVDNWFDYWFNPFERRRIVTVTGLPPYPSADFVISLSGGARVSIGACLLGSVQQIGDVAYGAQFGVTDYSKVTTDEFGVTSIVVRDVADRMTLPIQLRTAATEVIKQRLKKLRGTPCVWIASDEAQFGALVAYGIAKDWYGVIAGPVISTMNLEIAGLV